MTRVLITGSRDWTNWIMIRDALGEILTSAPSPVTVVHGGARGADMIAASIARRWGAEVEEHRAHWRTNGVYNPGAGPARNQAMIDLGADICLAFIKNNSRGATHCATQAERAGITTIVFREGA